MSTLRWGTEVPNDVAGARTRLVDAAEACFQKYGVMKTTVEDVARLANVSRATVYRYFAGRDELLLGVLLREADRFLAELGRRIDAEPDLSTAIVEGVLFTVRSIQSDEKLALLFAPEAAGLTTSIAGASQALFEITADFLRPYLDAAQGEGRLRPGLDLDEACEWVLRTILSLVAVDGPRRREDEALRSFLRSFLVPALVEMESASAGADRKWPAPLRRVAER